MTNGKAVSVKKTSEYSYAYATGRVRALENSLMNEISMFRLFEAKTLDAFSKVLSDSGYKINDSIEKSINNDLISDYKIISSIMPDKIFIDSLLLENDYNNLKVILKLLVPDKEYEELNESEYDEIDEYSNLSKEDDISNIINLQNMKLMLFLKQSLRLSLISKTSISLKLSKNLLLHIRKMVIRQL